MEFCRLGFDRSSLSLAGSAQQGLPESPQPQPAPRQTLPDAPSPSQPPAVRSSCSPSEQTKPPSGEAGSADTAAAAEQEDATPTFESGGPGGAIESGSQRASSGYDETSGIIRVNVNAVPVPVTVKDATGRLFPGLTKDNFSVYENGKKQRISFFTSDPFPVSAAIVVEVEMPEIALHKVQETFPALIGSFSQL